MQLFFPGFRCILALISAYLYRFILYLSSYYPDTCTGICNTCTALALWTGYLHRFILYLSSYYPDTCTGLTYTCPAITPKIALYLYMFPLYLFRYRKNCLKDRYAWLSEIKKIRFGRGMVWVGKLIPVHVCTCPGYP